MAPLIYSTQISSFFLQPSNPFLFSMIIQPRNKKSKPSINNLDDDYEEEEDDHKDSFGFQDLPKDVIFDILIRLPISSLIQFRLVCKPWKLLSIDPQLFRHHHSTAANDDPTLLFHSDYPIRNHLSFVELSSSSSSGSDSNGEIGKIVRKIYTPFSGSMPEFNVVGSCNGVLCLSDSLYGEPVFLFNPFSMDYLELPKSKQFQEQEVLFGFGFNPGTNEYKVVKIVYYRNGQAGRRRIIRNNNNRNYPKSEVQILTISERKMDKNCSWRCLGKVPYHLDRQATEAPVVNGRIHWVSRPGRVAGVPGRAIVSFDLKDEQFKVVGKPSHAIVNRGNYQLTAIKGCLAAVISCGYGKLEIWVMKEYDCKESWVKEFVIHGAFSAKMANHEHHHYGIWRWPLGGRMVRVLCVLKNGDILLEYRGGSLVKYDPKWKEFKDVVFSKMPKLFQTIVHVGTLNWVHT